MWDLFVFLFLFDQKCWQAQQYFEFSSCIYFACLSTDCSLEMKYDTMFLFCMFHSGVNSMAMFNLVCTLQSNVMMSFLNQVSLQSILIGQSSHFN